jgi:hypothetical protein
MKHAKLALPPYLITGICSTLHTAPPEVPEVDMQRGQDQRTGRHPQGRRGREWAAHGLRTGMLLLICVSEFWASWLLSDSLFQWSFAQR